MPVVRAGEFRHYHCLLGILAKHTGGEAVFLVKYLVGTHIASIARRIYHIGYQHAHLIGFLVAEHTLKYCTKVCIGGITRLCRCGIYVFILQKFIHTAGVVIHAIVYDIDFGIGIGEEIYKVVYALLQFAATALSIIRRHRATSLEIHT